MKVLALDTSSGTGSVALLDGSTLIAETLLNVKATHSERLLDQVQQILLSGGLALRDLDLIAVVRGPGSFTGLRIGLATAKGLAQAAQLPIIGISSLQMLAMNIPLSPWPVCTFVDARKSEVYTALFRWQEGLPVLDGVESVVPPEKALQRLEQPVALIGDAVALYRPLIDQILGDGYRLPAACHHQPRAAAAAVLGARLFDPGMKLDAANLTPVYIRPSDAELPRSRQS